MAYSGAYVFGDSLVDSGNVLKLAQWYGDLPFSDLPDGAPTASQGYFIGRFTNGYNFADLISNKAVGSVSSPIFPYAFEDPWLGVPIAPFASDPSGKALNFAYGGAQIRNGDEVVPDLDEQTDAFRDAIDGDPDANALIMVTMGGNDVRSLVPGGSSPASVADAHSALDKCADQLLHELSQLIDDGVHHILITGVPNVGLIPRYDLDGNGILEGAEAIRAAAATEYSQYLDFLIRTEVGPALEAMGATVTYVPLMDYVDANGTTVTGALNANLPTIAALHGLTTQELTQNLLQHQELLFFDDVHPNAQAHALLGAYMNAHLTGTPWIETLPLTGAQVGYLLNGSIAAPAEVDRVVLSLVAGTAYTFELLGVSTLGAGLGDPNLRLLGPGGAIVGVNDDSGVGFDATLTFTAATSGTYTLELSAIGSLTGGYVFQAAAESGAAMLAGNTYTVNSATTVVLEGAGGLGQDIVKASVSYALSAGSEIEVLRTTNDKGKGAIDLTGNDFDQTIVGNAGANILEGNGGADTLIGGGGKDVFVLSKAAVTDPGPANIDTIADYERGEIVDITQILSVAAGTNVISGGFLRVTTSGLIQVDLDGGGNNWVTLSTINGSASVSVRYLSGGAATNASVARTNGGSTSAALTGAVAAAGLLAMPSEAEFATGGYEALGAVTTASFSGGQLNPLASTVALPDRFALGNEIREVDDIGATAFTSLTSASAPFENASVGPAHGQSASAPLAALPGGTDAPQHGDASMVARSVAMPSADMLVGEGEAKSAGEVERVLADALGVVGADANGIDALFSALPANGPPAMETLAAWHAPTEPAFGPAHAFLAIDAMALHQDAAPTA